MANILFQPNSRKISGIKIASNLTVNDDIIITFDYAIDAPNGILPNGFSVIFANNSLTYGGDFIYGYGYKPAQYNSFLKERLAFINTFDDDNVDNFDNDDLVAFPVELDGLHGGWAAATFDLAGKFSGDSIPNEISVTGPQRFGFKTQGKHVDNGIYNSDNTVFRSVRIRLYNLGQKMSVEMTDISPFIKIINSYVVTPNRRPTDEFTVNVGIVFAKDSTSDSKITIKNLNIFGKQNGIEIPETGPDENPSSIT